MIRQAVRVGIKSGENWMGATAALALHLDVSPRMIRARCREELVGPSRMKRDIVEGCCSFIDMITTRQAEFFAGVAHDVARARERRQLSLPLDAPPIAGSLPGRAAPVPLRDVARRIAAAANEPEALRARRA